MSHQGDAGHTAGSSDAHDRIRRRAYELYVSRGGHHGGHFDDWLAAERELADRGEPSALTEASTLSERVDADAGVLGASSDADVSSSAAATAVQPNGKPAPARKAASKGTAAKAAPTKTVATKAAAPAKPVAAKPAAKSAAKAAPEASAPAAPKKAAPRKKGTGGQPTAGNGGAD